MFSKAKSFSSPQVFKHPLFVQIIALIVVAIVTSYLTMAQASIPRSEVTKLIERSEDRQRDDIKRLEFKQDKMLEKLEDLQLKLGVIGERVGVKK